MIKFPDKFNSLPSSIIGSMLEIIEMIPHNGIEINELSKKMSQKMDLDDIIDALTCLYAINLIERNDSKIYRK